jgi:hypothetical protein
VDSLSFDLVKLCVAQRRKLSPGGPLRLSSDRINFLGSHLVRLLLLEVLVILWRLLCHVIVALCILLLSLLGLWVETPLLLLKDLCWGLKLRPILVLCLDLVCVICLDLAVYFLIGLVDLQLEFLNLLSELLFLLRNLDIELCSLPFRLLGLKLILSLILAVVIVRIIRLLRALRDTIQVVVGLVVHVIYKEPLGILSWLVQHNFSCSFGEALCWALHQRASVKCPCSCKIWRG